MTEGTAARHRPGAGGPDGVVLLDKPIGLSSNRALQRVRRLFGARKAGHTGSLDPLASGLLPICLGNATRFSGYLLDAPKAYRASGRLGERTATGDTEGEVVERCDWEQLDRAGFERALARFRGAIEQVPPMYSALKQGGEPLYRKARRGEEVERKARPVEIHELELKAWQPPAFELELRCSKGTYVRTLVEDIARAAGSCAHLTALRRLAAGPFTADEMHSLASLEAMAADGPGRLGEVLLPADSALAGLPEMALDAADARRLVIGQAVSLAVGHPESVAGPVRLYGPDGFLGIGAPCADGTLKVRRLMPVDNA